MNKITEFKENQSFNLFSDVIKAISDYQVRTKLKLIRKIFYLTLSDNKIPSTQKRLI